MLIRGGYDGLVVLAAITRLENCQDNIAGRVGQDKTGENRGQDRKDRGQDRKDRGQDRT